MYPAGLHNAVSVKIIPVGTGFDPALLHRFLRLDLLQLLAEQIPCCTQLLHRLVNRRLMVDLFFIDQYCDLICRIESPKGSREGFIMGLQQLLTLLQQRPQRSFIDGRLTVSASASAYGHRACSCETADRCLNRDVGSARLMRCQHAVLINRNHRLIA